MEKTEYMFMVVSHNQTVGKNRNLLIASKSFESVAQFKYLGTTVTNQHNIHIEAESSLNLGNDCYHCVQSPLSSCLL
jgi:hypothetical protein